MASIMEVDYEKASQHPDGNLAGAYEEVELAFQEVDHELNEALRESAPFIDVSAQLAI